MRLLKCCLLVADAGVDTLPVVRALHEGGLAVLERHAGAASLSLALSGEFDLVAWHVESPQQTTTLARLAEAGAATLALVTHLTPALATACLQSGADACLQLDADAMLVVAQAHAILRRKAGPSNQGSPDLGVLQVGDLTVDVDRCEVERGGEFVPLTASEYRIVEFMARNAGRVLRPHEILNAVSTEYEYLPREAQEVFKVYVRRIRRKLEASEENPRYLVTVRGFGYRLEGGTKQPRIQQVQRAAAHTA